MNFHQSFKTCSILTQTSETISNLRINYLKGTLRLNKIMIAARGSYVNSMVKFSGASRNVTLCNFLKMLIVSDKTILKDLELIQLYVKQNPLDKNNVQLPIY